MSRIRLHACLFTAALCLTLGGLLAAEAGSAGAPPAQGAARSLEIQRYPGEPLEVVDIAVGAHSVKSKIKVKSRNKINGWGRDVVSFKEGPDWYTRVAVTLRNVSGRPVKGLRAYLFFKPDGTRTLYRLPLARSRRLKEDPLPPGAEIELTVHPNLLRLALDSLRAGGHDPSRASVHFSVDSALYSDELQWYRGNLMRRDPADPGHWTVVESPAALLKRARPGPAFARASYGPVPPRPQATTTCELAQGGVFTNACTNDPQGCGRVREQGNGLPGVLSTTPDVGPCEEVSGIDNPNIVCDDEVTHERLEEDSNCTPCPDADNDGYQSAACGGNDCDDSNPDINQDATEVCGDDTDNNCDGCSCSGREGDTWIAGGEIDCSTCNDTVDNDCDGDIDDDDSGCSWFCINTPVLVDVAGDGFRLTDAAGGVLFDLDGDGTPSRLAWTAAGSDDAWLALDRDGDGRVTTGRELFGNFTPQPAPTGGDAPNGFRALAVYDTAAAGGNGDGRIDANDAVFHALRLWRDGDHDGLSAPSELYALPALDVVRLHLTYKESRRTDEHGNRFRFRAKVDDARGAKAGRWAWDVFLVSEPAAAARFALPPLPPLFRQWDSPAGLVTGRRQGETLIGRVARPCAAAARG